MYEREMNVATAGNNDNAPLSLKVRLRWPAWKTPVQWRPGTPTLSLCRSLSLKVRVCWLA